MKAIKIFLYLAVLFTIAACQAANMAPAPEPIPPDPIITPDPTATNKSWVLVGQDGFSEGEVNSINLVIDGDTPYVTFSDLSRGSHAMAMKFDGTRWRNLGQPDFSSSSVIGMNLQMDQGLLYAGLFSVNNKLNPPGVQSSVKVFNGILWENIGAKEVPMDGCSNMTVVQGVPYVVRPLTSYPIYKFDGTSWVEAFDKIEVIAEVFYKMVIYKEKPYIAGLNPNGMVAVRTISNSRWVYVGNNKPCQGAVKDIILMVDNDILYLAYKDMENSGGGATVMKFNGEYWAPLGSESFSEREVSDMRLAFSEDHTPHVVYKDYAYSKQVTVMKFNGSKWEPLGTEGFGGETSSVDLAFKGNTPYVAYSSARNNYKISVMKFE